MANNDYVTEHRVAHIYDSTDKFSKKILISDWHSYVKTVDAA